MNKDKANKNRKKKLVLIGPVYPYKGGISHYTGLFSRALSKRFFVRTISYSMQYPKLLFPKEQRDYSNDSFRVPNARYLLNTANPFNIIRTARTINKWKPDLTVIEWWHPYFAPCYRILTSLLKSKVLFLCHNVFPHERFPLDRFLTKLTLKKGNFFILHSEKEAEELKTIINNPCYAVNPHPTYDAFKMDGETADSGPHEKGGKAFDGSSCDGFGSEKGLRTKPGTEAESSAEKPGTEAENGAEKPGTEAERARTLLFFGFVRPYKGLIYLIRSLPLCPDVKLVVAGDFGGTRALYMAEIEKLSLSDRVEIHDGYTPDAEVQRYFNNCDAAVLPYIDATQSGIAQIAFGFSKPVIATRVGGLPEVIRDGETGILCAPKDPKALAEAIERFYSLRDTVPFEENIKKEAERFSWDRMVEKVEAFL